MRHLVKFIKPKTHANLKEALMHKAKQVGILVAYAAVAGIMIHWLVGGQSDLAALDQAPDANQSVTDTREPSKGTPQYVLNKHRSECWVGNETPKAELPGAAIVQFVDGRTVYTKKHSLVDAAFNEVLAQAGFDTKRSDNIVVVALCK